MNGSDARDWVAMIVVGGGFVASWVYVFMHPSEAAFTVTVGAVGTFGAIFHWLCVHDDKIPDHRE